MEDKKEKYSGSNPRKSASREIKKYLAEDLPKIKFIFNSDRDCFRDPYHQWVLWNPDDYDSGRTPTEYELSAYPTEIHISKEHKSQKHRLMSILHEIGHYILYKEKNIIPERYRIDVILVQEAMAWKEGLKFLDKSHWDFSFIKESLDSYKESKFKFCVEGRRKANGKK